MGSISAFNPFMNLPSELRINIWQHALPGPRVVAVRFSHAQNRYISDTPPPALLHASPESRSVFLSRYEKLIISATHDSSVFVDFERDTVFFDNVDCSPRGDLALDLASSPHRNKILQCAIDAQLWEVLRFFRFDTMSEIKLLRNLKSIALVLRHDDEEDFGQALTNHNIGVFREVESNTIGSEIRHVHWYVESIRWELEHGMELTWLEGAPPKVQMWIW